MTPHNLDSQTQLIGAFILNFGAAETATYQWITELTVGTAVRDRALKMTFSERLKLVCELVSKSDMSEPDKQEALRLWGELSKFGKTRNMIAHSPLAQTPDGKWCIIDFQKMKGAGPYKLEPLHMDDIARQGAQFSRVIKPLIEKFCTNVRRGKAGDEGAAI